MGKHLSVGFVVFGVMAGCAAEPSTVLGASAEELTLRTVGRVPDACHCDRFATADACVEQHCNNDPSQPLCAWVTGSCACPAPENEPSLNPCLVHTTQASCVTELCANPANGRCAWDGDAAQCHCPTCDDLISDGLPPADASQATAD